MTGNEELDYEALGLKVGLEIHQQLKTRTKLFCSCPAELTEENAPESFTRRLRPTRSETGDVDIAALFEYRKGRVYRYEAPRGHYCLVESDEEPPHPINRDAVAIAIAIAKALGSTIVDEVHVMRKIVIDGSNTSGFQRTAIVALGGKITVNGKDYGIQTIVVEEDAARKVGENGPETSYRLDRLGIPLIEISTAPDMHTPSEARDVALAIGMLLRMTGAVRRGLGTIRQDLNVSIAGGAKTEIKGVQTLELIDKIVKYEVMRQVNLLKIRDEMVRRGITKELIRMEPVDVTDVFRSTKSKVIAKAISEGGRVLAIKLPRMKGLLGTYVQPGRRFGTEIADYVRFWANVQGLFHSDELPNYGITQEEVNAVHKALGADPGVDAFAMVAEREDRALRALSVIVDRVRQALDGVPEETRAANEDGTTKYMRPRPGRERMYPETDIPPLRVTPDILAEAEKLVPEPPEAKVRRFVEKYGMSRELAEKVVSDPRLPIIEEMIYTYGSSVQPTLIASIFVTIMKGLRGKGVDVDSIDESRLESLIRLLADGKIAKEAIEPILTKMSEDPKITAEEAAKQLGLIGMSREEAEAVIDKIIAENMELIKQKGEASFSTLMGKAMGVLRGKVDGKTVSDILRSKLRQLASSS
ncbi:Glutamyl-tRNA(Gln) amidotransferase subunit E [Acidilobus saccharovorans 345-15]|uniref:Glutamyl-tRNA(Gln) amidotransferase subunit E n=1 Tax=Acidilobus saccharovorans (strain DSM 16705 / JCM 18335 / VKM B-2471 / 345-15) TaxID=666510 RepID=D9Q327_ACIS3|nr:Glu-tRNA(Gln) amidotransferase subunit GatE [Acidilobus saccharovorans]ADL19715.1 Glutamyl-tRNA(Gln) amidotransferase subunit E [Acidilobus saccharovorans 345-15]